MRIYLLLASLIYTINLADANQQSLLRVQWLQLQSQQAALSDEQKFNLIQSLTATINPSDNNQTRLNQVQYQMLESGVASDAELVYAKWSMLVELGLPEDHFRMVYLNSNSKNKVVLVYQGTNGARVFSRSHAYDQAEFETLVVGNEWNIVSVINPEKVQLSRTNSRTTMDHKTTTQYL